MPEKPPTNDELRRIFDAADVRQKVAISLMAFSGFRDETLGDLTGIDGLKISDFPEMTISNGTVQFNAIPTFVICRATISKDGYEYRSLLNEEGCDYLRTYLTWRMQTKEKEAVQPSVAPSLGRYPVNSISDGCGELQTVLVCYPSGLPTIQEKLGTDRE